MRENKSKRPWRHIALTAMGIFLAGAGALSLHSCSSPAGRKAVVNTRTDTIQGPNGTSTITITTGGNIDPSAADSMMRKAMEEIRQTDSIMQEMMNGMMADAPFASEAPYEELPAARNEQVRHRVQKGMATLAGRIGNREFAMALNMKDSRNVKGTGSFIAQGKQHGKLHALGIQDGGSLTVSLYNASNHLQGTLSGIFNGVTFEGTYLVNGQETPFRLYAQ